MPHKARLLMTVLAVALALVVPQATTAQEGTTIRVVHSIDGEDCHVSLAGGQYMAVFDTLEQTVCVEMPAEASTAVYLTAVGSCTKGALLGLDENDETHYLIIQLRGSAVVGQGPDSEASDVLDDVHSEIEGHVWDSDPGHDLVRVHPRWVEDVDLDLEEWVPTIDDDNAGLPC